LGNSTFPAFPVEEGIEELLQNQKHAVLLIIDMLILKFLIINNQLYKTDSTCSFESKSYTVNKIC
jgi:hypothetical protein